MNELIKTTSVDRGISGQSPHDLYPIVYNIRKSINSSAEYKIFKKRVNAETISMFPVSETDIIYHTIIKHLLKKETVIFTKIMDEIFDKLYNGEIPYLLVNDCYNTYWMLDNVMTQETDIAKCYNYLKRFIFPIINQCLRIPSSEKSVNEFIGEVYGRGNIPDDKYALKLWNAYCKYRENMSKEDDDND